MTFRTGATAPAGEWSRGLLDAAGLPPRAATVAHGAAIWGSAQVTLPALDIAPPAIFWAPQEIAIDAFHHAVYAVATGIAYELLSSRNGAGSTAAAGSSSWGRLLAGGVLVVFGSGNSSTTPPSSPRSAPTGFRRPGYLWSSSG